MYSEGDLAQVNARIRRTWLALGPVLALLAAAYGAGFALRLKWLAMAAGALLAAALCYGLIDRLWPNMRYRAFLRDMQRGLSRTLRGRVVAIDDTPQWQDGARVLPVRLRLAEGEGDPALRHSSIAAERLSHETGGDKRDDERILYLNVAKRDLMPGPGTEVRLSCYGRHIKAVEAPEGA